MLSYLNMTRNEKFSPPYGEPRGQEVPTCSECHQPIRKQGSKREQHIPGAFANPPWNAGWGGVCEHCGKDYCLSFTNSLRGQGRLEIESGRNISVQIKSEGYRYFIDELVALAGVEITINTFGPYLSDKREKLFISIQELKEIMRLLQNSPVMEQYDWGEDWT